MPGSGINELNIAQYCTEKPEPEEFHLTGRKIIDSEMIFHRQNISMGGIAGLSEFSRKVADPDMIRSNNR